MICYRKRFGVRLVIVIGSLPNPRKTTNMRTMPIQGQCSINKIFIELLLQNCELNSSGNFIALDHFSFSHVQLPEDQTIIVAVHLRLRAVPTNTKHRRYLPYAHTF